jgi:hypothetical protein
MAYIGSSAAPIPVAFAAVQSQSFNGTGSQTAFTISRSVPSAASLEVLVNNVQQSPYDGSYSVNGTTLTFSEAPSSGTNNVYVIYRDQALGSLVDSTAYRKSEADTLLAAKVNKAGDTMTGALVVDTGYQNGLRILRDYNVQNGVAGQAIQFGAKLGSTPVYPIEFIGVTDTDGTAFGIEFRQDTALHLKINAAGHVTTPYQPAFQTDGTGYTLTTNQIWAIRPGAFFNIGSHYNSSNGRFTAPVDGRYHFHFMHTTASASVSAPTLYFRINGSGSFGRALNYYAQYSSSTQVVLLNLNAGDYVEAVIESWNGNSMTTWEASWGGYLVG